MKDKKRDGKTMFKRHKICKIFIALMLILFFLQPVNADIFIEGSQTKYEVVYDGNPRDVETIINFYVNRDGEVYFKLFAYEENDALNEGWWVHYLVYDNNILIKDLGNKSGNDATDYVSVSANKIYTLKAFVHIPGNLFVNQTYQCMILLCEHSGTGGGSGGTIDDSEKFILSITPTTTYLIYGHVYDKNGKTVPNIDVNITNMETGNSTTTKTNATGFYSYNLYNLGYHNNDRIMGEVTYNNLTGHNITTVNIENNCSECNIVIPTSVTGELEENNIIWVITGVMVGIGITISIIFMRRRYRK